MKKKTEWLHEKSVPCRYTHVTCQNAKKKEKKRKRRAASLVHIKTFLFFKVRFEICAGEE